MEESLLMQCAATMGVAMVPVLELRGAIPFGLALGLPASLVYVISVIGNLIPVPAIMLFIRTLFRWLRRRPWWGEKIDKLENRAHLKGRMVRKYRIPGLILLVAIPLPGTGAWTGALVATLFDIRIGVALPAILAGVLIAGGVMTAVSCGVLSLF
ncbi:MAG: small multi-drug export protein [Clostridiales bacterium]|uniref:COG2426 family protein n=1 Tax=Evtepia sp. TaxID=2773933 RepID=UPI0029864A96|nr:small multi-drug export protein [Evtepia sp.]MDD7288609.1 small multi-drug export protein [Clostridiales bacterium]MDY3992311.1 small multi-drug export protein [Evtepia sp.]MDY4429913.1 small multi-drug export protein [Evtepia sp.]